MLLSTTLLASCLVSWQISDSKEFTVEVVRERIRDNGIHGRLLVNKKELGGTLERKDKAIPKGSYKGVLRYGSEKGFVQGPEGSYGHKGDFLLEIKGVARRTNILFHGGTKPEHSEGCVLLGPISKAPDGTRVVPDGSPLRNLRIAFYGTDTPNSTPFKEITIVVSEQY